ncbi:MAG: hypothetical protein U0Q18_31685 [Bryobacteraceae bacterium]
MLRRNCFLTTALFATAAVLSAGGFFLTIHAPDTRDAVLTVEAEGCHDYSQAKITGHAEGIVDGKRESVPLVLAAGAKPGRYNVRKQWPTEGKWILVFEGLSGDRNTHTVVELGPDGRPLPATAASKGIRMMMNPVAKGEIEAALR